MGEALSSSPQSLSKKAKNLTSANEESVDDIFSATSNGLIAEKNSNETQGQPLYDIPRSNPRRVSPTTLLKHADSTADFQPEAIYVNDNYTNDIPPALAVIDDATEDQASLLDQYDIPRSNNKSLSDLIPQAYDVPKNRDSLSTIEEEHQEYDIPKPYLDALIEKQRLQDQTSADENTKLKQTSNDVHDDEIDVAGGDPLFEGTNLYENQQQLFSHTNSSNENIYANEDAVVGHSVVGNGSSTNLCNSHR